MLNYDSEDIDGMDDGAGDDQEPAPTGHWKASSTHDVYMVDTPKGRDNEEQPDAAKDNPPKKQPKRQRKRHQKSRLDKDAAIEQVEPVDDEHALEKPSQQDNPDRETEHPSPRRKWHSG